MTLGECKHGDIVRIENRRYRLMIRYTGGAWGLREVLSPEGVVPGDRDWKESGEHTIKDDALEVEVDRANPTRADVKVENTDPLMG
jgi:hypothetical protein